MAGLSLGFHAKFGKEVAGQAVDGRWWAIHTWRVGNNYLVVNFNKTPGQNPEKMKLEKGGAGYSGEKATSRELPGA